MPRLGLGSLELSSLGGVGQDVVTTIDDFFFESNASGEVNPMLTTSRTNLVTSSEDFTSDWGTDDVTFDVNSTTAPDGTSTADKIIGSTVSSRHNIVDTGLTNSVTASISVHAKAGELRYLQVASANTTNQYANFDLLTGTIGNIGSDFANVAMDSLANGWYRITLTSVGKYNNFYLSLVSGLTAVWLESWSMSNNTDGLFLWGAQLEEDGFASAYIPTSGSTVTVSTTLNDTSNVWDFDGTDIMIAEDPEDEGFWEEGSNLVLNHDYEELGSELITNGDFATDSNWSKGTGWSIANGKATHAAGVISYINQLNATTVGKLYKAVFTLSGSLNATNYIQTYGAGAYPDVSNQYTSAGTYTLYFTADATYFRFRAVAPDNDVSIENVSVKQVDPNDRWTLGTGWTISGGKASNDGSFGEANSFLISSENGVSVGSAYEVTFTISNYVEGNVRVRVGQAGGTFRTANGTYTEIQTATTTETVRFQGTSSFTGSVDNVTVREYAIQPQDV